MRRLIKLGLAAVMLTSASAASEAADVSVAPAYPLPPPPIPFLYGMGLGGTPRVAVATRAMRHTHHHYDAHTQMRGPDLIHDFRSSFAMLAAIRRAKLSRSNCDMRHSS